MVSRASCEAVMSRNTSSSAPWASYASAASTGSPASRRSTNRTPLTTRPSFTSRHGITRLASTISLDASGPGRRPTPRLPLPGVGRSRRCRARGQSPCRRPRGSPQAAPGPRPVRHRRTGRGPGAACGDPRGRRHGDWPRALHRRDRPTPGKGSRGVGRRPGPLASRLIVLAKRVIPCLDVKDGRVVKGVRFVDLRDAGDPVEAALAYDAQGADELVFLDITASHEARDIMLDVVRRTAEGIYMPLTVGGGVRSVDDVRRLLRAGADKVSLNTAALARPEVIREAAQRF